MRKLQVREIDLEQLDFGTTEDGHRYVRNLKLNILGIVINLSDFQKILRNKPVILRNQMKSG